MKRVKPHKKQPLKKGEPGVRVTKLKVKEK
jgi:hypothetical protein